MFDPDPYEVNGKTSMDLKGFESLVNDLNTDFGHGLSNGLQGPISASPWYVFHAKWAFLLLCVQPDWPLQNDTVLFYIFPPSLGVFKVAKSIPCGCASTSSTEISASLYSSHWGGFLTLSLLRNISCKQKPFLRMFATSE